MEQGIQKRSLLVEKLTNLSHIHPLSSVPFFYSISLPKCTCEKKNFFFSSGPWRMQITTSPKDQDFLLFLFSKTNQKRLNESFKRKYQQFYYQLTAVEIHLIFFLKVHYHLVSCLPYRVLPGHLRGKSDISHLPPPFFFFKSERPLQKKMERQSSSIHQFTP